MATRPSPSHPPPTQEAVKSPVPGSTSFTQQNDGALQGASLQVTNERGAEPVGDGSSEPNLVQATRMHTTHPGIPQQRIPRFYPSAGRRRIPSSDSPLSRDRKDDVVQISRAGAEP